MHLAENYQPTFRKAKQADLAAIVEMLIDDPLGVQREEIEFPLADAYQNAFEKIDGDANQELIVAETVEGQIVGTLQLSFIQYLTYRGGLRAQIEAVRIDRNYRGKGLGKQLIEWAIERAKKRGAHLIQLTTDKSRPEAISFYSRLGFQESHEGFKLHF